MKSINKINVIATESIFTSVFNYLKNDPDGNERFAIILCGFVSGNDEKINYLTRKYYLPGDGDLESQGRGNVEPKLSYLINIMNECLQKGYSIITLHSHPFTDFPHFSRTDDSADRRIYNIQRTIYPEISFPPVAIVTGQKGMKARFYKKALNRFIEIDLVRQIGPHYNFNILDDYWTVKKEYSEDLYDRQLRFLGAEGQRDINDLVVGIIGLGGIGALAIQQLARLGVKSFILCDDDLVEKSNLNRLVDATYEDIGKSKVEIGKRLINKINPEAEIKVFKDKVNNIQNELKNVDILFGCVDSEGARLQINEISVRYLIPYLDFASAIFLDSEKNLINGVKAQFRLIFPGETRCLICNDELNLNSIEHDLYTEEERDNQIHAGYISGQQQIPTPSVISLNSSILSTGIIEFMKLISGFAVPCEYILYNALNQEMYSVEIEKQSKCPVCGKDGFLALGDLAMPEEEFQELNLNPEDGSWLNKF